MQTTGNGNWKSVTSSADGTKMAGVVFDGQIYTSSDSGTTWIARDSQRKWKSITSSSDGTKLAAVVDGGYIYTSNDAGISWIQQSGSGQRSWSAIASSANGSILVASEFNGLIYTSSDSGVTWTAQTETGSRYWSSLALSSDGLKGVGCVYSGYIFTYVNGTGWTLEVNLKGPTGPIGATGPAGGGGGGSVKSILPLNTSIFFSPSYATNLNSGGGSVNLTLPFALTVDHYYRISIPSIWAESSGGTTQGIWVSLQYATVGGGTPSAWFGVIPWDTTCPISFSLTFKAQDVSAVVKLENRGTTSSTVYWVGGNTNVMILEDIGTIP
jgi:hypothetical protein